MLLFLLSTLILFGCCFRYRSRSSNCQGGKHEGADRVFSQIKIKQDTSVYSVHQIYRLLGMSPCGENERNRLTDYVCYDCLLNWHTIKAFKTASSKLHFLFISIIFSTSSPNHYHYNYYHISSA